jgi:hypothetical protein
LGERRRADKTVDQRKVRCAQGATERPGELEIGRARRSRFPIIVDLREQNPRSVVWTNFCHHDVGTAAEHEPHGVLADGDNRRQRSLCLKRRRRGSSDSERSGE